MGKNHVSLLRFMLIIFLFNGNTYSQPAINLGELKQQIIRYYENGDYLKDAEAVVKKAEDSLNNFTFPVNAAAVFDIDETVLLNYPHIKKVDFGYIPELWDQWVALGDAPAIEPVKKLYDFLVGKNVKIIFITGRKDFQYEPTFRNLQEEGFTVFDTLITRRSDQPYLPASQFKENERAALAAKGYNIIMCVGDQYSDMTGDHTGFRIKVPNYLYRID